MTEEESWLLWQQIARAVHRHVYARGRDLITSLPAPPTVAAAPAAAVAPTSPVAGTPGLAATPLVADGQAGRRPITRLRVRGKDAKAQDRLRRMQMLQHVLAVLNKSRRACARETVLAACRRAMPPLSYEEGQTSGTGSDRYDKKLEWIANIPRSCGWLTKTRGMWQITKLGSDALERAGSPADLMREAHFLLQAGTITPVPARAKRRRSQETAQADYAVT